MIQLIRVIGLTVPFAPPVSALTFELPAAIIAEQSRIEMQGSYDLPIAPFADGTLPFRTVEGNVSQRALRLDAPGRTTQALHAAFRAQVIAAGFEVLLDCESRACGGFDFRYLTEVLPEPDMHVDLGDFRFLSAVRGDEAVSILVSRSALSAYVQITLVTPAPAPAPRLATPPLPTIDLAVDPADGGVVQDGGLAGSDSGIGAALDKRGSVVLEDLVFASGAATLAEGDYASLAAVAAWLVANPDATISVVGHTDASGGLAANIALSERRAEAVAQALVESHGADRQKISSSGVGFLSPRASNQTEEGRQKNRRVEVVVTSTR